MLFSHQREENLPPQPPQQPRNQAEEGVAGSRPKSSFPMTFLDDEGPDESQILQSRGLSTGSMCEASVLVGQKTGGERS